MNGVAWRKCLQVRTLSFILTEICRCVSCRISVGIYILVTTGEREREEWVPRMSWIITFMSAVPLHSMCSSCSCEKCKADLKKKCNHIRNWHFLSFERIHPTLRKKEHLTRNENKWKHQEQTKQVLVGKQQNLLYQQSWPN